MNRLVCGIAVDEDIYDKYNFDKETGRRRMYTLCGQERSLETIEYYAYFCSERIAKESTELVTEAQRIAENIRKEIRNYYAAKEGRREYEAMKHNNFSGYLADLQEIHAKAAPERIALKEKWDAAQEQWKRDKMDFKKDEHYLARQKVKYLDAQENYKNSVEELQVRTQEEIGAVQAEFERHVADFYAANGDRIDDGTVRLFNSGIKLTDAEIDGMVNQNRGNPTMLRLIAYHCEKMKIKSRNAVEFGYLARKAGSDEREAFKAVSGMVMKAVSREEITAKIWSEPDSHFKKLSDEQIGAVNSLQVRPETSQSRTAPQGGE